MGFLNGGILHSHLRLIASGIESRALLIAAHRQNSLRSAGSDTTMGSRSGEATFPKFRPLLQPIRGFHFCLASIP
jgi:hypothetical protein